MNPEAQDAIRLLKAARYYVERPGGWGRYVLGSGDDSRCLLGAIMWAAGDDLDPYRFLCRPGLPSDDRLWRWNDAPGRTQAEVVNLFDAAIELLERGEA